MKTKGAAEMLIKRRLGILKNLIQELGLRVKVEFVKSELNKADELTRVRKRWLVNEVDAASVSVGDVKRMHDQHHMGVERTWFLVKKIEAIPKETVKKAVSQCEQCQSIDPAPVTHTPGELNVCENWTRLAIDVAHYRGIPYLTMVDCGPGRFAMWRELKGESASEICKELENVFYERGPVTELLMDNAATFRAEEMKHLLCKWRIKPLFRAAYRPSGNGIVERHHRTIKTMAERLRISPLEAVYWYNISPRDRQNEDSVPQKSIFKYDWSL